jgi:hypothetical protein
MLKRYTINLINVKSKVELIQLFDIIFDFTYKPFKVEENYGNWDSFYDSFRSLDQLSNTIINDPDFEKITGIHLIFQNYKALDNINPQDKKIFEEILEEMTHKENRYDNYDFSYEENNND